MLHAEALLALLLTHPGSGETALDAALKNAESLLEKKDAAGAKTWRPRSR